MNIDSFLQIEKKYGLNSIKCCDVNYWTFNRFNFWNYDICASNLGLGASNSNAAMKRSALSRLTDYFKYPIKYTPREMLVLSHPRRVFNGSDYECLYTDELVKDKYDAVFLEMPFQFSHLKPTYSKNIFYNDRILVESKLKLHLCKLNRKRYSRIESEIRSQIKDAIFEMKDAYNWDISLDKVVSICAETVIRCNYEKKRYKKILERIKPKVVLEVVHYERPCMLINEAAKELHIPTVELQHGTMYREHAAYQYAEGEKIPQLPDKLFAFSEFWKNCISFPIGEENIVVTGFPNFEKKIKKYAGYKRTDFRKTIVFVSQGTIGKQLSEFAVQLCNALPGDKYRLIYKLHPSEYDSWKKERPALANSSIEVIHTRDIDLYELFAQADVQVGAYSTAVFEGMGFGLRTMIYNVGHYDIMLPLIEQGYAYLVTSVDDFVKYVDEDTKTNNSGLEFWKENAKENIRRELDSIIQGE
jgi:hypothetical protein